MSGYMGSFSSVTTCVVLVETCVNQHDRDPMDQPYKIIYRINIASFNSKPALLLYKLLETSTDTTYVRNKNVFIFFPLI